MLFPRPWPRTPRGAAQARFSAAKHRPVPGLGARTPGRRGRTRGFRPQSCPKARPPPLTPHRRAPPPGLPPPVLRCCGMCFVSVRRPADITGRNTVCPSRELPRTRDFLSPLTVAGPPFAEAAEAAETPLCRGKAVRPREEGVRGRKTRACARCSLVGHASRGDRERREGPGHPPEKPREGLYRSHAGCWGPSGGRAVTERTSNLQDPPPAPEPLTVNAHHIRVCAGMGACVRRGLPGVRALHPRVTPSTQSPQQPERECEQTLRPGEQTSN